MFLLLECPLHMGADDLDKTPDIHVSKTPVERRRLGHNVDTERSAGRLMYNRTNRRASRLRIRRSKLKRRWLCTRAYATECDATAQFRSSTDSYSQPYPRPF